MSNRSRRNKLETEPRHRRSRARPRPWLLRVTYTGPFGGTYVQRYPSRRARDQAHQDLRHRYAGWHAFTVALTPLDP